MIYKKQGSIINVSSMWGQVGGSCEVHYSAAKGALQAMTQALAKEVGPSGIRVNCVAPGVILTEMNTRMFDAETLEALKEETPLEKLGETEDIANMIYFLARKEAGFITGQIIGVNGGMVI
ncbi:MAG: SDR family oxidoreductase, partial [Peptococcaceae bacterium]|nr:SDR family oxidoreductase [Peptococcaceae bacterium]